MTRSATITMNDGVKVVVPNSLNLITPYVLVEQQDWFEDEIKFLRLILKPGQQVIDIGANYGLYTLTMAKSVGPSGNVWSFEPASTTASFLADSISCNDFSHVVLERSAISSASGSAKLTLNEHSEMNSLVRGVDAEGQFETVKLVTLDESMEHYSWKDISFLKIDAEGEESKILKGGVRFFSELSPLVQYEVKAGDDLHLELAKQFEELGYDSFQLVPGLNCLVPFDREKNLDVFLLNLFCCKKDRRDKLAASGWLVNKDGRNDPQARVGSDRSIWRDALANRPYTMSLIDRWDRLATVRSDGDLFDAISNYAVSQDLLQPPSARFSALEKSFGQLVALSGDEVASLRLASLARVAVEYGERFVAVRALEKLVEHISSGRTLSLNEPFLTPTKRFEMISPVGNIGNWILASALEAYELAHVFSSFYTNNSSRSRLEMIQKIGLGSPEMDRRLRLLTQRFG